MNKTNHLILVLLFFSLAFIMFPFKVIAGDNPIFMAEGILGEEAKASEITEVDQADYISIYQTNPPSKAEVGDMMTSSQTNTGKVYKYVEPVIKEVYGIPVAGKWVPYEVNAPADGGPVWRQCSICSYASSGEEVNYGGRCKKGASMWYRVDYPYPSACEQAAARGLHPCKTDANCRQEAVCMPYEQPTEFEPPMRYHYKVTEIAKDSGVWLYFSCFKSVSGIFSTELRCSIKTEDGSGWRADHSYYQRNDIDRYECNRDTYQCEKNIRGLFIGYKGLKECEKYCEAPPMRYSCNPSTWSCEENKNGIYASLSSCKSDCTNKCIFRQCLTYDTCDQRQCLTHSDCVTLPTTTTTTLPPEIEIIEYSCKIINFNIPNRAWVGYDVKAEWSTTDVCTWAEITCKLEDGSDCGDRETLSGEVEPGPFKETKFKILESGIYRYQLKACGDKNMEESCVIWEDVLGTGFDYIEVEALHLPWWQEIIPILPKDLQGFLRGLFGDR